MLWMDPAQVTLPGLQARLKAENWGANKSDGLYASTQQHAHWKGRGNLNQYLKHAATPAKKEFQLLLFQGPDLDDTLLAQRVRGALEAGAVCHLWDLQSSWHQRCQDGMFLDFKKLGKRPSGLPWDQEN